MTRSRIVLAIAIAMGGWATSSFATVFQYEATLDGLSEFPSNDSPGTGFATFDYDDVAHTFHLNVSFGGLEGTTSAAHIHTPTAVAGTGLAGVATTTPTFAGFPLGVTSGTYDITLDLTLASSYNPAFVTANGGTTASAEAALMAGINAGKAYLNLHTSEVSSGEIRGFLVPVPEPASALLIAGGSLLLVPARRRRLL